MNITRSSRRLGIALSLTAAVLFGACAQNPSESDTPESNPVASTAHEPPLLTGLTQGEPPAVPESVALRPDHPQTYTVVPGDTLWGIAERFLQHPWQWREIWRQNPQVGNPHRIYPGNILRFSYDADGKPQLEVAESEDVPLIKLSPQIRVEELSRPIPPVPRDAIESFLTRALILSDGQWKSSPYIVADDDEQIAYTDRDRVYARGASFDQPRYQVFRPSEALHEPGSGRYLGTAGIYMGQALLEKDADPATLVLANTIAPVRAGDRLFPLEREAELYSFEPRPAPPDTYGFILAKLDTDVTQITQYSSVIINLGAQEGLSPGHVLAIYGKDRTVDDPISGGTVRLPGERSGLAMVYKVHDLVSYALVMQAERAIRLQDRVMTP
ncbi:MAG: LysM peptidoglycan-binding domain-containing protein [Gammaproteobacteria bacterium]|nr:LysM peptidoglycan-binding domain-containing protein [Gammaproteobacteria bacterium]